METKYGFIKMTPKEFEDYISNLRIARTILFIQQHHTYIPAYVHFKENNHFELQKSMKNTHINQNGWADIGQHLTIFPDGYILTGRSFEKSPACITGNNANSICIENLGNFDKEADEMNEEQKDAIINVTASLCKKFNFVPDTNKIVYHHWFNLSTGVRNNGSGNNKSCPGTNFFGGNNVKDCQENFIPLLKNALKIEDQDSIVPLKYVYVTASSLNIRVNAGANYAKADDRLPAKFGAILRVYEEKNGWYRISSSAQHWVSSHYTKGVKQAIVKADSLNIRSGAGVSYPKIGALTEGTEVFVYAQKNGWSQISMESRWVKDSYLKYN